MPGTNRLRGLLYCARIVSDCYGEFQAVSTVKRKILWNIVANLAWQLVSFMLQDRTQKSCKSSLVLTTSSSSSISPHPFSVFFLSRFVFVPKTWCLFWSNVNPYGPPYHSHEAKSYTAKLPFPPDLSYLFHFFHQIFISSFFFHSNSPAAERGAWGGARFLDYFWCAMRIL